MRFGVNATLAATLAAILLAATLAATLVSERFERFTTLLLHFVTVLLYSIHSLQDVIVLFPH